jgi:pyridoxal phosphate enzyme (YggS family)
LHKSINNLALVKEQIKTNFSSLNNLKIIAVSKTFPMFEIDPLIKSGHIHFGENKVQEAVDKWTNVKKIHENLKLHMIGKLQTNKVKYAVPLFDYIHSLDNIKLAEKIAKEQEKLKKNPKIFIQVNIGNEPQKTGILINDLESFLKCCVEELKLNIIGLMCIPPQSKPVKEYFKKMDELNKFFNLKELSMGMSQDYLDAINYGSTYVRIGSNIFGQRS